MEMPSTSLKRTNSIRDSPNTEDHKPKKNRKIQNEEDIDEENEDIEYSDVEEEDNDSAIERPSQSSNRLSREIDFNNMDINHAGTIARVEVVNFMCHKYLKVDLGPKINFVIGHNGSGKSAILTAITLALGANANSTNRGRNLSSFIKEGTSAANITIHLTNGGDNPYRSDLYPGLIVIERRLNKEGPSPYKVKNSSGKIISQKKEELVAILDHFSILVNNPLTMLTQDMARKFLSDSTSEDKYKLFMNGTQLTQLRADFDTVRESLETAKVTLDRKKEGIPALRNKFLEDKQRVKERDEARKIEGTIDVLNNELVWSQISLKEKEVKKLESELAQAEKRLETMKETYEAQKDKINQVIKNIEEVNTEWDMFKNVPNPDADEKRDLLEQKVNKETQQRDLKAELVDINSRIKSTRTAKEKHEQQLKIKTDKLEASSRLKRNEILDDISKANENMVEKAKKAKQFAIEYNEIGEGIRTLKEKRQRIQHELAAIRKKRDDLHQMIRNLEAQRGDRMRAYGHNMPQVLDAIRRENRWKKRKPVGPIGATLKLLETQYAETLEVFLNKNMNAFIVECFEDKNLLFSILSRLNMTYTPIMVAEYDLFDYSSGEPDEKYLTVLRAIKFEDEWIKRQFIISNKIEKTLLMESRAAADDVMLRQPRNIHMCFTSGGHKVGGKSGMKTETLDPYRGSPRFQTDVDGQINKHKEAIVELKKSYEDLEPQVKIVTSEIQELEKRQRSCRINENRFDDEIKRIERYIDEKNDTLKEDDPVDLNMYEEDIKECNDKIQNYAQQFQNIHIQREAVLGEMKEILKKIRVIEIKEEQREAVSNEYRTKVSKLHDIKSKLTSKLDEFNTQKQTLKTRYEGRKSAHQEAQRLVATWIQECSDDYPDRVETNRTPQQIETEIRRLQGVAEQMEELLGSSIAEVEAQALASAEAYDNAKSVIEGMDKLARSLSKMLVRRNTKWEMFRDYMSLSARHFFAYYLHLRGDEGSLKFNHNLKKLEIRVSTGDQYSKGSRQKDSRSLSGGEKSFSQISLLLSLWQSISSPIICLDEFDVFMDAVNRKQTMSMIMNAASENSSQYILITPQDASNMVPGKYVTIHRLADPDR